MKIDQLSELQEISRIQARTAAKRIEGQAIIAATRQRLAELKTDLGIETDNQELDPSSGTVEKPSDE